MAGFVSRGWRPHGGSAAGDHRETRLGRICHRLWAAVYIGCVSGKRAEPNTLMDLPASRIDPRDEFPGSQDAGLYD